METQVWLPIVTLFLGLGAGYLVDWHKEKRATAREREDRWHTFQREAILEAQDLLWEFYRWNWMIDTINRRHFEATGQWPQGDEVQYPGSVVMPKFDTDARMTALQSRIDDELLVDIIAGFRHYSGQISEARDLESSDAALDGMMDAMGLFDARTRDVLPGLH
jgi:hypothetical protein